jgi:hypothetical protein
MTDANRDLLFSRFVANPPAGREEVAKVQQALRFRLPDSYVEFLQTKNGGEGFIGKSYLALWKVEDLIAMNSAYHVSEFVPKLFLFGSDGGGEAFGFDTRTAECRVVSVPFVGMDLQQAVFVASDFEEFLSVLFKA